MKFILKDGIIKIMNNVENNTKNYNPEPLDNNIEKVNKRIQTNSNESLDLKFYGIGDVEAFAHKSAYKFASQFLKQTYESVEGQKFSNFQKDVFNIRSESSAFEKYKAFREAIEIISSKDELLTEEKLKYFKEKGILEYLDPETFNIFISDSSPKSSYVEVESSEFQDHENELIRNILKSLTDTPPTSPVTFEDLYKALEGEDILTYDSKISIDKIIETLKQDAQDVESVIEDMNFKIGILQLENYTDYFSKDNFFRIDEDDFKRLYSEFKNGNFHEDPANLKAITKLFGKYGKEKVISILKPDKKEEEEIEFTNIDYTEAIPNKAYNLYREFVETGNKPSEHKKLFGKKFPNSDYKMFKLDSFNMLYEGGRSDEMSGYASKILNTLQNGNKDELINEIANYLARMDLTNSTIFSDRSYTKREIGDILIVGDKDLQKKLSILVKEKLKSLEDDELRRVYEKRKIYASDLEENLDMFKKDTKNIFEYAKVSRIKTMVKKLVLDGGSENATNYPLNENEVPENRSILDVFKISEWPDNFNDFPRDGLDEEDRKEIKQLVGFYLIRKIKNKFSNYEKIIEDNPNVSLIIQHLIEIRSKSLIENSIPYELNEDMWNLINSTYESDPYNEILLFLESEAHKPYNEDEE